MMNVLEYIQSKNYNYRLKGNEAIFNCPFCGDTENKFAINIITGAYNCLHSNRCGVAGKSIESLKYKLGDIVKRDYSSNFQYEKKVYDTPKTDIKPADQRLYQFFNNRGISKTTVDVFGVRSFNNEIAFPYYKDGKRVAIKYRGLNEKRFRDEKNCMPVLYGQDLIDTSYLIICEGQIDAMSAYEYNIKAVSVPSGVNNMKWIENDWDFINKFEIIYIMMDNDHAGQSSVEKLVSRLGRYRCKNVVLPEKDLNECLIKKYSQNDIEEIIFDKSIDFDMKEIKCPTQYIDELSFYMENPELTYGLKTNLEKLTDILKGWRKKEVTVWTGRNGSGKSTFLNQEIIHLIDSGSICCIGSFELPPIIYLAWLMRQHYRKQNVSRQEIEKGLKHYAGRLLIFDIVGEINKTNLFELMEFASMKYGVDHFVIDSLMKIHLGVAENKIYGEQKKVVSDLSDFSKKYDCHIHLVAHPRKSTSDENIPDKGDIAGSGDITNLADNVIVIHRVSDEQKEKFLRDNKEAYDTWLKVLKNRAHGEEGGFGLFFESQSKRFQENNPVFDKKVFDNSSMDYINN